jgi:hypothetical protein
MIRARHQRVQQLVEHDAVGRRKPPWRQIFPEKSVRLPHLPKQFLQQNLPAPKEQAPPKQTAE